MAGMLTVMVGIRTIMVFTSRESGEMRRILLFFVAWH